jgi:hypothetical protein
VHILREIAPSLLGTLPLPPKPKVADQVVRKPAAAGDVVRLSKDMGWNSNTKLTPEQAAAKNLRRKSLVAPSRSSLAKPK